MDSHREASNDDIDALRTTDYYSLGNSGHRCYRGEIPENPPRWDFSGGESSLSRKIDMSNIDTKEAVCDANTCTWNPSFDNLSNESIGVVTGTNILHVKKIYPDAQPLKKSYEKPACIDIAVIRLIKIENGIAYFGTGWSFEIPSGYFLMLFPRSSMHKYGFTLVNCVGIIDEDYRGEIIIAVQLTSVLAAFYISSLLLQKVSSTLLGDDIDESKVSDVINKSMEDHIKKITFPFTIAQFCLIKKENIEIEEAEELSTTERGDRGFGSSDKK